MHAAYGYRRIDFGNEALKNLARAELYELGSTVGNHVAHGLCPADRGCELSNEISLDFGRVCVGKSVYILINGAYRHVELGCLDSGGKFGAGGLHAGRVERTAYLELERTLGTGGLEGLAGSVDSGNLARDYELAGAVIVGADNNAVDTGAYLFYLLIGKSEHCGHGRFGKLTGFLHSLRTGAYKTQTVFKAEGSGSYKS